MYFCEKLLSQFIKLLEEIFYRWGRFVARRPWFVIVTSLLATSLFSLGLINLRFLADFNELWISTESPYIANNKWLIDNFPQDKRIQSFIFHADPGQNILSPESLKFMMKLHKRIAEIRPQNISFQDICYR